MKNIKHYFASGNTNSGFVNLFKYINECFCNPYTFVIKGGSGTGKSTLMKKVAEHFYNNDFSIEMFHCSSDINSLDGVRIVELNIALVDGTFPHITEVDMVGVSGKIINVGECVSDKIKKFKNVLEKHSLKKQMNYKKLYNYLNILGILYDLYFIENTEIDDTETLNEIIKYLDIKTCKKGSIRYLFLDALTDCGINNLLNLNNYKKVFNLNCANYNSVFNNLEQVLKANNVEYIIFKNIFKNTEIIGVEIPCKNALIYFNINQYYSNLNTSKYKKLAKTIVKLSQTCIINAKKCHSNIEKYYIKNVNFNELNKITDSIILQIENMIK